MHDTPCATYATFYWHSVEKLQILSHQKKNFFAEINSLVPYLVKPLLSRNFSQKSMRENFYNFHTVTYLADPSAELEKKHKTVTFNICLVAKMNK